MNYTSFTDSFTFSRNGKTIKNRVALAPMTNLQSHADGTLSDAEFTWMESRAAGNFGLLISCATHVQEEGMGWPGELGIFSDLHIPGWQRLAAGTHKHQSLLLAQLFHGGARSPEKFTGKTPRSASAHVFEEKQIRESTTDEIEETIEAFIQAAIRTEKAGLDGVELHGAHGYLIHQFLSKQTNQRTDEWGKDRLLFLRRIIQGIRREVSDSFLIGVRLSPEDKWSFKGIDIDECRDWCIEMIHEGTDIIHLSPWDVFKKPEKYPNGEDTISSFFRKKLPAHVPIMVAGGIKNGADAQRAINEGADLLAIGRMAIPYPNWPELATDLHWSPMPPPYTEEQLRRAKLSQTFVDYMKGWKNFVAG